MIEFIRHLYNWLQQFTNHCLIHCHLLPTGHSTATILTSNWTELHYSVVLLRIPSILLTVPSYNSSVRTSRKTPSFIVKNSCLLVRYLAIERNFGNVFTELLLSNGHMLHIINRLTLWEKSEFLDVKAGDTFIVNLKHYWSYVMHWVANLAEEKFLVCPTGSLVWRFCFPIYTENRV
jgi:hypothetical protein